MENRRIETMAQALEIVGISIMQDGEYRLFDDVMCELQEKWHILTEHEKQEVAKSFVRCFL